MSGLLLLAAALSAQAPVRFPGPQTSVRSPTSSARVFYVDLGADRGGRNLSLRFDSGGGRPVVLQRFYRSVDVGWSPSGARFYVNDYAGSSISDCLVVRPDGARVRGVSLIRVIARSPGRPRETPANSHYYVNCSFWVSDTIVDGVVTGHVDALDGRSFDHAFRYDAARGRISWR